MNFPTFKEVNAQDISKVFLNLLEFADIHIINGKEMAVVMDDNELLERDKSKKLMGTSLGDIYQSRRLIYVSKGDFGRKPAPRNRLTIDGVDYLVKWCTEEVGILAIEVEKHEQ